MLGSPLDRRRFLRAAGWATLGTLVPSARLLSASPRGRRDERDALLGAVRSGDETQVAALLARAPGLAASVDDAGVSAYVLAHLHGHARIAELLLATGLELDLLEAALAEDHGRVERIASLQPDEVDRVRPAGGTALAVLASLGAKNLFRMLSLGADPNLVPSTGFGRSAVQAAFHVEDPVIALSTATELLGNSGLATPVERDGDGLLHVAVSQRSVPLARLALRKGADPERRDALGERPLDRARRIGAAELVALLERPEGVARDHRASRFRCTADGSVYQPPSREGLDPAKGRQLVGLSHGDLEGVRAILREDPRYAHSLSFLDEAAIEAAAHTGREEIARLLLEHGAPYSLPTCLSLGDLERADEMLADDPLLVHERGAHDFAFVWYTVIGPAGPEGLDLVLDHGADVDQESEGTTALHFAANLGRTEMAEALLDAGANPEAIGHKFEREGETPRDLAARRGHRDLVRLLDARSSG